MAETRKSSFIRNASLAAGALWALLPLAAIAAMNASFVITVAVPVTSNRPSLGPAVASNIMADTAYLGGSVTATNGYPVLERGVYWGTNSGTVLTDGSKYSESGTFDAGGFSFWVTNLPSGRTNYFLAYAANGQGTSNTAEGSFLTRPAAPGILPPTNITTNALSANWQSAEGATNYLLDVALTNDFAEYLDGYSNRPAGVELTCLVTGLQSRGVYYYRARAENAAGVSTNSGVMTVAEGTIGLWPASLSYSGVYGGTNPAPQDFTMTNSGYWDFNFTNSAGYSGGATGWWTATPTTGALAGAAYQTITGIVNITGLNAGTYYATNAVISAEATNSPQHLAVTLTVNKADQAITGFTPTNGSVFATTDMVELNATGGGSTNPVTFTVLSGPGMISEQTHLTFTNSGTVRVTADQAGDTNWNSAPTVTQAFNVGTLSQTITFPAIPDQTVTSGVGLAATASSGLPVSFSVGCGPGAITGNTNLTFTATGAVSIVASQTGNTFYAAAPDTTNIFHVLPAPIPLMKGGWVAIHVTPESGTWRLTVPAAYAGPVSGTGSLAAASAPTGLYSLGWGALSGYVAPADQTQFVIGGNTTIFAGVYLMISTNIGTPSVSATEGTYTNKIRISWQGVDGVLGYEVWRSRTNSSDTAGRIADIPANSSFAGGNPPGDLSPYAVQIAPSAWKLGNTYIYDDYDVMPVQGYYYWVRAKTADQISLLSYVGMGYSALPPDTAGGAADLGVSDLVYLPVNVTNLSHAGTVSCRLANYGPEALADGEVAFDFHMNSAEAERVWIGSDDKNYTLAAGEERLVILSPDAKRSLTVRGDLSGLQQVQVTVRHMSALQDPNLTNNTATGPGRVRVKSSGVNSPGRSLNDYDGDGKSDVALCRADKGVWAALLSGARGSAMSGIEADTRAGRYWTAAGDYDGDGVLDYGLYEEESGNWWIQKSRDGSVVGGVFGGQGFRPVAADYDGDGKSDPAVYGLAWGYWAGLKSGSNYALGEAWVGGPDYEPVMADYDGDGLADPMAYREAEGDWAGLLSGQDYAPAEGSLGGPGYRAMAMDFDGDGLADPGVYQEAGGVWLILLSSEAYRGTVFELGGPGYAAAPGDYDGDGRADPGVYAEREGAWYGRLSGHNYEWAAARFGGPGYQVVGE